MLQFHFLLSVIIFSRLFSPLSCPTKWTNLVLYIRDSLDTPWIRWVNGHRICCDVPPPLLIRAGSHLVA